MLNPLATWVICAVGFLIISICVCIKLPKPPKKDGKASQKWMELGDIIDG